MGERSGLDAIYAKAAGLTHESRVPGTEHRRELTNRLARGEVYRALLDLRHDVVKARTSEEEGGYGRQGSPAAIRGG